MSRDTHRTTSSVPNANMRRRRSMVSTVFAPGVPQVEKEFNSHSSAISSLMVSIYVMGSALGPFLTPLTEVSGRLPVTHSANVLFMIAAIVCATAVNMPMLIIARFAMGVASSIPVTVGGGFVADLMPMERRGTAMTVWTVGPLLVSFKQVHCFYVMILTRTLGICNWPDLRGLYCGDSWLAMDGLD